MTTTEKKSIQTLEDLMREALRRAGLADSAVEWGRSCKWAGKSLTVGRPSEMNQWTIVVALFHDEHTIRVYEVQRVVTEAGPPNPIAPRRISLSKASPSGSETFVVEDMTLERMADVLADELSMLEGAISSAARERNAILDFGRVLPPEYPLKEFLEDLEQERHLEEDDDGEEDDAAAAPAPAAGG